MIINERQIGELTFPYKLLFYIKNHLEIRTQLNPLVLISLSSEPVHLDRAGPSTAVRSCGCTAAQRTMFFFGAWNDGSDHQWIEERS